MLFRYKMVRCTPKKIVQAVDQHQEDHHSDHLRLGQKEYKINHWYDLEYRIKQRIFKVYEFIEILSVNILFSITILEG